MSTPPAVGVDAALDRLVLEQRVAVQRAQLGRALSSIRARARRAGAPLRLVRARPAHALLGAFAIGLLVGLACRRIRS